MDLLKKKCIKCERLISEEEHNAYCGYCMGCDEEYFQVTGVKVK